MSPDAQPVLRAHGVRKRVRDGDVLTTILDGIDLEITAGERLALVGASGSGKSTLLHILGALDPDYEGRVELAGKRLDAMTDDERAAIRNRKLGFVFQSYNLLGHLSALENVSLPARFGKGLPNVQRAREVLEHVGLAAKASQEPHTLSGGERQRVAIARALYNHPELVLCDEPTGNLDRKTAEGILELFASLTEQGVALLIATHDTDIAEAATRVVTLREGALA